MEQIKKKQVDILIGCYTDKSDSEGIYKASFDLEKGEITQKKLVAKLLNPSYFVINEKQTLLYSVEELQQCKGKPTGQIKVFSIKKQPHQQQQQQEQQQQNLWEFEPIQEVSSLGQDPCYLSLTSSESHLMCANYTSGSITLYRLDSQGKIDLLQNPINIQLTLQEKSSHPRQECAHAHSIQYLKTLDLILVADLGGDRLISYKLDQVNNTLIQVQQTDLPKYSGPRHFIWEESSKRLFLVGELCSQLLILNYNTTNNQFQLVQSLSTVEKIEDAKNNQPSHILMSDNKQHIYVANRKDDSISQFMNINENKWKFSQIIKCGGSWPRFIQFSPDQKFILIANQLENIISIAKIDSNNGKLILLQNQLQIGSPAFIYFLK